MNENEILNQIDATIAAWFPKSPTTPIDINVFDDDVPDVEDYDIEAEIDRYFRQVEDSYSDVDFNAQMGW